MDAAVLWTVETRVRRSILVHGGACFVTSCVGRFAQKRSTVDRTSAGARRSVDFVAGKRRASRFSSSQSTKARCFSGACCLWRPFFSTKCIANLSMMMYKLRPLTSSLMRNVLRAEERFKRLESGGCSWGKQTSRTCCLVSRWSVSIEKEMSVTVDCGFEIVRIMTIFFRHDNVFENVLNVKYFVQLSDNILSELSERVYKQLWHFDWTKRRNIIHLAVHDWLKTTLSKSLYSQYVRICMIFYLIRRHSKVVCIC